MTEKMIKESIKIHLKDSTSCVVRGVDVTLVQDGIYHGEVIIENDETGIMYFEEFTYNSNTKSVTLY